MEIGRAAGDYLYDNYILQKAKCKVHELMRRDSSWSFSVELEFDCRFLSADCNGSNGSNCHHRELLPDWPVWSATAPLPLVESRDGHHFHRHPGGTAAPLSRHVATDHKKRRNEPSAAFVVPRFCKSHINWRRRDIFSEHY